MGADDAMRETYGSTLPGMSLEELPGKIIVIEGTDGVGRSTQIAMLKPWLEQQGHAVVDTGMTRSELVGRGIKQAKEGHTLGRITLTLFYATDFADRLEREIIPALRAGFVVLTDRYIYSLMARALVRELDAAWVRNLYSFALKPDAVFYLRIGVEDLVPRVVFSTGFDYWESGMDLHPSEDMYESFRKYQSQLLAHFDKLAEEYNFEVIDATKDVRSIFEELKRKISRVVRGEAEPLFSIPRPKPEAKPPKRVPAVRSPRRRVAWGSAGSARGARPRRGQLTHPFRCLQVPGGFQSLAQIALADLSLGFAQAQDQLSYLEAQRKVGFEETALPDHVEHGPAQDFEVVPVAEFALQIAEAANRFRAPGDVEFGGHLHQVAQTLGGDAQGVEHARIAPGFRRPALEVPPKLTEPIRETACRAYLPGASRMRRRGWRPVRDSLLGGRGDHLPGRSRGLLCRPLQLLA